MNLLITSYGKDTCLKNLYLRVENTIRWKHRGIFSSYISAFIFPRRVKVSRWTTTCVNILFFSVFSPTYTYMHAASINSLYLVL